MKEHPLICNTFSVKAILDGRKTQTRRVIKPRLIPVIEQSNLVNGKVCLETLDYEIPCPYGQVGDRLWVRETFRYIQDSGAFHDFGIRYEANGEYIGWKDNGEIMDYPINEKLRPSIHMPRWASRISLEITDIRVERLQEITTEDAKAEGVDCWEINSDGSKMVSTYRHYFQLLWDSINGKKYPWDSNPWVWCISFKKLD